MPIRPPTLDDMRSAAAELGLHASDEDLEAYRELLGGFIPACDAVEQAPEEAPRVRYPRGEVRRPRADENPYGAWVQRVTVEGAAEGPLAGRSVVLKDNVCLAGVPMGGGASFFQDYVPPTDATIVERILDAGGTIVGKAACEYLSASGGSHTSATGPVHNPRRHGYTTGGSSSGCGALVAAGEVDLAIGGDQGGSIRIPASFCGIVGLKPTYGLVPYTGILSIEATIDHTGPMTANVADNARLLEVIAGPDGLDPRQAGCRTQPYTEALGQDVAGLRIGIVEEGFRLANSEADVNATVRAAAARLEELGAKVEGVSIPEHVTTGALTMPFFMLGTWDVIRGGGFTTNVASVLPRGLPEAFSRWREGIDRFPEFFKVLLLGAVHLDRNGGRPLYAKGVRLRRELRAAYDRPLQGLDLLLMPATPMTAQPIPAADAPLEEQIQRSSEMIGNTAPFDLTGHPAISIPCGELEGLPVGLMLVGRHWEESTIYRAAHAYERSMK